jgi:hypothetical protein
MDRTIALGADWTQSLLNYDSNKQVNAGRVQMIVRSIALIPHSLSFEVNTKKC